MTRSARAGAIVSVAVLAAVAILPHLVSTFWVGVLTQALIYALLAASLDVLLGYSGLPSLGQAAFFGLGGYGVGLGITELELDPLAAAGLGVGAAALGGVVFGPIALRGRGIYFLILTLAIAQMLWGVAVKFEDLTGGFDGIAGITRPDLFGANLAEPLGFYYFVAAIVVLALLALWLFVRSPVGLVLQGIRESESRMDQLGYRTSLYRWAAFSVAALFGGIAGTLSAFYNFFVSPEALFFTISALAFLMVIVGGSGTLWGPAVAGFGLIVLENVVRDYTDRWVTVVGGLYIAIALFAPGGLLPLLREKVPLAREKVTRRIRPGVGARSREESG